MALLGSAHLVADSLIKSLSFVPRLLTLQQEQSGMVTRACIVHEKRDMQPGVVITACICMKHVICSLEWLQWLASAWYV